MTNSDRTVLVNSLFDRISLRIEVFLFRSFVILSLDTSGNCQSFLFVHWIDRSFVRRSNTRETQRTYKSLMKEDASKDVTSFFLLFR